MNDGEAAGVIQELGWTESNRKWLCNCCQGKASVRKNIHKQRKATAKALATSHVRTVTIGKRQRQKQ